MWPGHQAWILYRISDCPDDVFDAVVALNLRAMFHTSREVARRMVQHGINGSIVSYSSISSLDAAPYHGVYGAAKAGGISALTRRWRSSSGLTGSA